MPERDLHNFPKPRFTRYDGIVQRMVESQEETATLRIAASLDEQARLETLIDNAKPAGRGASASGASLHYLLSTPFRYPPLRHGSRFGSRFEPSLFYASLERRTCLRECAYYRLLFWHDMATPPPNPIRSSHTLFSAAVSSGRSADLRSAPFDSLQEPLRNPVSYRFTQALGAQLRSVEAEVLLFTSARGPGSNVALYTPAAFAARTPRSQSAWLSEVNGSNASFSAEGNTVSFSLAHFSGRDGELLRARQ